jgi:hypothetical protein
MARSEALHHMVYRAKRRACALKRSRLSTRKKPFYPSPAIVYVIPPYCFDIL